MTEKEWDANPDKWPHTPPIDVYRKLAEADKHLWWRMGCGHHQNLFEAAAETRAELLRHGADKLQARAGRLVFQDPAVRYGYQLAVDDLRVMTESQEDKDD